MDASVIESFNNCDYVDCINTTRSRASKDGNQHMFFQREWPRVQRKRPCCKRYLNWFCGKCCSHKFPKWQGNNLSRDRSDFQRVGSVA
ncbi:hypothetical protein MtrunA17_Chr7g0257951 [Medicago truncatula]|uniref:Uncharacterized protein n=1 Tax=Medicago truncatula TaxID=3880 RepID=A0A396HAD6_MEDTR|nr:hypothetical protein MtrunA17_Chr7g0257951 [Medicago truncatula]